MCLTIDNIHETVVPLPVIKLYYVVLYYVNQSIHLVIIYLYILIRTYRINRLTFSNRICRERIELMMTTGREPSIKRNPFFSFRKLH